MVVQAAVVVAAAEARADSALELHLVLLREPRTLLQLVQAGLLVQSEQPQDQKDQIPFSAPLQQLAEEPEAVVVPEVKAAARVALVGADRNLAPVAQEIHQALVHRKEAAVVMDRVRRTILVAVEAAQEQVVAAHRVLRRVMAVMVLLLA